MPFDARTPVSKIGAIAAMTRDRVIGRNNDIPWHYSEDFRRFKQVTLGGTIIMGRKTWESIGSRPLPGRRNIVISRQALTDIKSYTSIQAAVDACAHDDTPIWFIGGGQIYREALPLCGLLDITWVPDSIDPEGAVLFPRIDPTEWQAQQPRLLEADPRLTLQQFTRI